MRVDVINLAVIAAKRHFHAADGTFARWRDHVISVRCGTITDNFAVNLGTARFGMLIFFQNQNACAPGDNKSVTVFVIGAGGYRWSFVIIGRHRRHRIKQNRHGPIQLFTAACKHQILFAILNHFGGIADAMVGSGAGRRDRIIDAFDLEPCGQGRRGGGRHAFWHGKRTDALRAGLAGDVSGLNQRLGGRAARAHDNAGALIGDFSLCQARVGNSLIHRHMVPGCAGGMKTHGAAVEQCGRV